MERVRRAHPVSRKRSSRRNCRFRAALLRRGVAQEGRSERIAPRAVARRIYDLHVCIAHTLDLRDAALCATLAHNNVPYCFLERQIARTTAHFLRGTTPAQAVLVPSMALFDQAERYAFVLFLDQLPADPRAFITSAKPDGLFRFGDSDSAPE